VSFSLLHEARRALRVLRGLLFKTCLSNFSKVWPPAGPPEATLSCFYFCRTKIKSPPAWPALWMLAYSGVWSAFQPTCSLTSVKRVVPSMVDGFALRAEIKADAKTEWLSCPPLSITGSRPPDERTTRAFFFEMRFR